MLKTRNKVPFDVSNREHLMVYDRFIKTSSWGKDGCFFDLEEPFISIPHMIDHKLALRYLNHRLSQVDNRAAHAIAA